MEKAPNRGFTCLGYAASAAPQPRPEAASRGAPGSAVPTVPPRAHRSDGAATAPAGLGASGSPQLCSARGEGRLSVQLPLWGFLPLPGGTLVVKTLFLISSWNLPCFSSKLSAVVLLQQVLLKTLPSSFLLALFMYGKVPWSLLHAEHPQFSQSVSRAEGLQTLDHLGMAQDRHSLSL